MESFGCQGSKKELQSTRSTPSVTLRGHERRGGSEGARSFSHCRQNDLKSNGVYGIMPQKHGGNSNAPLMFVNINDRNEVFAVPQEYPYRHATENHDDSFADMVYPLLPKAVKTMHRTLLPLCPASNEQDHSSITQSLDSQLTRHVESAIGNSVSYMELPAKYKDTLSSPEGARHRRHLLFAKQWKRNAMNECLFNYYLTRFKGDGNVPLKQHVRDIIAGDESAKRLLEKTPSMKGGSIKNDTACAFDRDMVRDWIKAGPNYSKTLSDALGKYHDFLHKKLKANSEIKRKVAATSRYFFEILAEAKECERKMHERELVTEERLYGRKDFIAEIEKENQMNRNRCKRLYAMYLQCQKRCSELARNARVNPNETRVGEQQGAALYAHEMVNDQQRPGASGDIVEATAANIVEVAQPNYDMHDCVTTAAAAGPATQEQDDSDLPVTQSTQDGLENRDADEPRMGTQMENGECSADQRSHGVRESSPSVAVTPSRDDTYVPRVTKETSNNNRMASSNSWDQVVYLQHRPLDASSGITLKRNRSQDETMTPTRRIRDSQPSSAANNSRQVASPVATLGVMQAGSTTPSYQRNTHSPRGSEIQLSNRLSSVGGVNRWIYSKMEERGELDGYRSLLNELNTLLFSKGGTVLGYHTLPQALDWLDETDANRTILPPSQDTFRDGTLYTTCSFAEIKLLKVLQGGICALRSRVRSRDFDCAVLRQILDANSELVELKKKLDNGRCALYKKLKRDWAERNSKWAGFPPLKRGYRLLNMLGKGGFAEVWEVLDPITLTVQAAKLHILSSDMNHIERGNVVMRVKNEIDIHKTCRTHKNIVNMKACFEMGDNMLATILELCDDGDLDHYIKLHAPVPEKLALTWTYQILEGLHYMKTLPEGRVHHCDLKPGNILKHKGNIKLADFGLSKMVPHESTRELWGGGGTICYQPPECLIANVRNKQVILTDKIDIWAVGCILYEMLYNSRPFGFGGGKKSLSERMYHAILGGVKFPANDAVSEECKVRHKLCA
ncbi:Serine/threonine-protein kinase TOUSLED [Babesia sp. Xinjiang]|uniref:Serine/threonine-protein kinase TOUSLED n=1 Tax=Babesia sp. Xinjiang TaxID=462227 RepID=UPI000A23E642|nr:Serine/threonine-protein kinase TOUSLED [Babesia sp. Xinjiang]ORM39964.1 Serine/threonine-protein kinase TOUSLED [Babesia sp. Xinjiang]